MATFKHSSKFSAYLSRYTSQFWKSRTCSVSFSVHIAPLQLTGTAYTVKGVQVLDYIRITISDFMAVCTSTVMPIGKFTNAV